MRWVGSGESGSGVSERRFELTVGDRPVPGCLWRPADRPTGPSPLVLMAHGATLHKRVDHLVALAHLLVRDHGISALSLDAPGHGDRRPDRTADEVELFGNFLAEWARPGSTDEVVEEWARALDAVHGETGAGEGPIGFWGLSMGTIYGVPFVASEHRVQAAVFGLMGLLGPTRDRLEADSRALACPVLFVQQWDDQLVPRADALALFDAVGSMDKRLHAHPGLHAAVPAEELAFSVEFLARHLGEGPAEDQGPTARAR